MSYKWCAVPQCENTSIKTPEKLFVNVPRQSKMRKKWLQMAGRDPKDVKSNSHIYFCEDHFNIAKDMANYSQYKMGFSQRILVKDDVVPSKFDCQISRLKRTNDKNLSPTSDIKRHKKTSNRMTKKLV
ncbi:hypothetical protein ABEB36_015517 [Hypothenemus hampei]|uniref:THAP-type domain-containing protein n=1 Tax=Hypothenemus hampei TaxID=57062 RepID=A0ABD1DZP0_HYPHA